MFYAVLLAAFVFAVSCQTPPTFSDDFTAEVNLDMVNGHRERRIEGTWFFDHTGKRDRFDGEVPGFGRIDAWKIWNSTKGGNEYFYNLARQSCHKAPFTERLFGVFDFLPHSKLAGKCDGDANLWSLRVEGAYEMDACVTVDGQHPRWIERKNLVEQKHHVVVRFHSYKAGRPSASQFVPPTACNQ